MANCKVEGCNKKERSKGYCERHYHQMYKNGKISGNPAKSMRDSNDIIIEGDIIKIVLRDREGNKKAETIIDTEDYEKVKNYKWHLSDQKRRYAKTSFRKNGKHITYLLQYLIIGKSPKDYEVDHINRDRLDNRKSKLRFVTKLQQNINVGISKNNTSGFKGVYFGKNKYVATMRKDGGKKHLGSFNTPEEAAMAYDKAAFELHGEYAYLNFTKPQEVNQ